MQLFALSNTWLPRGNPYWVNALGNRYLENPLVLGLGFFVGLIPGPAAVMSSFLSYAVERRISKRPHEFGKGAMEGVAGPEAANNASTSGAIDLALLPTYARSRDSRDTPPRATAPGT